MRHIGVALKHIDRGVRRNSNSCPVSLAIKEVFRASYVNVAMSGIRVEDELYATPQKVADWIARFDIYGPDRVKPLTFTLEAL